VNSIGHLSALVVIEAAEQEIENVHETTIISLLSALVVQHEIAEQENVHLSALVV